MSIFDRIDGLSLLEDHANELLGLEDDEAKRILGVYQRVAKTLRARLARVPENTFTEQQIRVALAQVETGIRVLQSDLEEILPGSIEQVAGKSAVHLAREAEAMEGMFGGTLQPINLDAVRVASNARNLLFNRYQSSLETYSQGLRSKIANGLTEMIAENVGWDSMVGRMMAFFGNEEWMLRRIVRTELHNVYGVSKLLGMRDLQQETFPDLRKTLYHPIDSRTGKDSLYAAQRNLVVRVDEPFRYEWPPGSGKVREFMAPPDRPNDRSILIPFRPSWA